MANTHVTWSRETGDDKCPECGSEPRSPQFVGCRDWVLSDLKRERRALYVENLRAKE